MCHLHKHKMAADEMMDKSHRKIKHTIKPLVLQP